jgi:hypothetical protein
MVLQVGTGQESDSGDIWCITTAMAFKIKGWSADLWKVLTGVPESPDLAAKRSWKLLEAVAGKEVQWRVASQAAGLPRPNVVHIATNMYSQEAPSGSGMDNMKLEAATRALWLWQLSPLHLMTVTTLPTPLNEYHHLGGWYCVWPGDFLDGLHEGWQMGKPVLPPRTQVENDTQHRGESPLSQVLLRGLIK